MFYPYPHSGNWKINRMMIHYLLASSLETIINTTIHNDLLRDGLCLKVIFVCFKYDDDFITWEFRNLLIEFIKKKKKSCTAFSCSIWDYF